MGGDYGGMHPRGGAESELYKRPRGGSSSLRRATSVIFGGPTISSTWSGERLSPGDSYDCPKVDVGGGGRPKSRRQYSVRSMVVARPARPQPAATPTLASFGLTAVRCACCGANICGVRHSCTRCNAAVDEACMARVSTEVHCFTCTCRACRGVLSGHLVQCRKCNFRVHGECTTDGLCTLCSAACASSGSATVRKPRKFNPRWLLSRPWLRYDPVCVLMWCEACCTHPQIGCSVPFVQGTSIFKVFSLKVHGKLGTHCVSLALWKTGCRVSSVIRTLPTEVQDGIMGLFRTVYRLVQSYEPMTNLEGDSELVALNGGHILPSYRSRVSSAEILRFIVHPLRASQGAIVTECEFFAIASDSCTDR